jgi:hypothetical protein
VLYTIKRESVDTGMQLVRIVKDWTYPETFFGQTPENNGMWGDIHFTEEAVTECDFLIVLQRPAHQIEVTCPEGNVWLITQEPPVRYFRFLTRSFKYFDRVYSYYNHVRHPHMRSMQPVLPWHVLKSYSYLHHLSWQGLKSKDKELVWITSNRNGFEGQKLRMVFKNHIEQSSIRLQVFGRGFTPIADKFDGLSPFKYALAIENFSTEHYWTEKIVDALLSWCLPFYWGAPNLEDYLPSLSFIRIDISDPQKSIAVIEKAMQENEWEKRLEAIAEARNLILNRYQFFPWVSRMINEQGAQGRSARKKKYVIPANPYPWRYKFINQYKYYAKRLFEAVPLLKQRMK